jgi:two-component system response regulator
MIMPEGAILLIEDNADDELLTIRALRRANIANEIMVARDGAEALAQLFDASSALRRAGRLPRLVLLDLKLPKVGGLDLLRRIRADQQTRLLPVVVLTSSSEQRDIVESYHRGANSYVRKPVDVDQFMEAMRQLGLYWMLVSEPPLG